jgi:hypothetical protein
MPYMLTRIDVRDYETWKPQFDQDKPRARESASGWRVFRGVENPNEVFIQVEFASVDDAKTARERLLASGVLDRFDDKTEPRVVEEAEAVTR